MVVHHGRLFLPTSAAVWPQVLEHAHGMVYEGIQKTLQHLHATFFMPDDNKLVHDYIKSCLVCQRNKTEHLHLAGLLQPLAVPNSIWRDIVLDFVEGFPRVGGKSVILMMVDRFSRYTHFVILGHLYSVTTIAKAFFDSIVHVYGVPASMVSDQDPVFTSMLWNELFCLTGTKLCTSSAFHSQTDGQSEVMNKIITVYLRCLVADRPQSWLQWLPWAEFCFNTSYQMALHATPFEVVYDQAPPPLLPFQASSMSVVALEQQLCDRDMFMADIKEQLLQAQSLMKAVHDKKHCDMEFVVDD
jgi:hypothetical protein